MKRPSLTGSASSRSSSPPSAPPSAAAPLKRTACGGRSATPCRWPSRTTEAVWRVSVAPTKAPRSSRPCADALAARWFYDWGGGLVWIAVPADGDAGASVVRAAVAAGARPCDAGARAGRSARRRRRVRAVSQPLMRLSRGIKEASILPASSSPAACTPEFGGIRCRRISRPEQLADPHMQSSESIVRSLRALRLLHGDVPDLCAARRRARQPARPHLPDQGHAGDRQARRRRRCVKHIDRCLSCLVLHDDLSVAACTTCISSIMRARYIEETYRRSWHDRLLRAVLRRASCPIRGAFAQRSPLARLGAAAGAAAAATAARRTASCAPCSICAPRAARYRRSPAPPA